MVSLLRVAAFLFIVPAALSAPPPARGLDANVARNTGTPVPIIRDGHSWNGTAKTANGTLTYHRFGRALNTTDTVLSGHSQPRDGPSSGAHVEGVTCQKELMDRRPERNIEDMDRAVECLIDNVNGLKIMDEQYRWCTVGYETAYLCVYDRELYDPVESIRSFINDIDRTCGEHYYGFERVRISELIYRPKRVVYAVGRTFDGEHFCKKGFAPRRNDTHVPSATDRRVSGVHYE
ncbi:unnamed protein product [Periconia digitata]|uniref:Uncharacterized protein n=1 Tax=Periconia digitata TaxID=1303443 RepID=A0A9W4XXF7_9PLEO|nr:unnamed protein product [Periconia digitata]